LGVADIETFGDALRRLRTDRALWRAAAACVSAGYGMLERGTYGEAVEQRLLKATGRIQMCAGWLAFDAGHQRVARTCYTEALALARQVSSWAIPFAPRNC
jgi:hypothetical protein